MRVRALYIAPNGDTEPCWVRVHTKFAQLGDQKGTSLNSAETEETVPALIFWREELVPKNTAVVTISEIHSGTGEREAYQIGVVLPPDGLTITARVAELSPAKAATYPVYTGA